jgi:hypothetical protein
MADAGANVTAADLLKKLQMSRAAQHAAVSLAATKAPNSPQLRRKFIGVESKSASINADKGKDTIKEDSKSKDSKERSSTGFNSFMLEGLAGWRTELLSRRFRQAVAAEFFATGA